MKKRMSGNSNAKEIFLGDDFGEVVVHANKVAIQIHADGRSESADATAPVKAPLKPGDKMADGTIYAGASPDTREPMYAMPAEAPGIYDHDVAKKYARKVAAHGHSDWRVPTKNELNALFNNRAAIGGFNETGSYPAGWYWSSSCSGNHHAWAQRFSDGKQVDFRPYISSSLRFVR
jgi:hypothetical protein